MKSKVLRQRIRQGVLILSVLSFPVIMNYLSPYVIIDGASQGIINGSFIMFGLMFLSSLFLGRLWCSWLCPGGGLGEICLAVNDRRVSGRKIDWIKWVIWVPWLGIIAWAVISAGGYKKVDFFHLTETGISVVEPYSYVIYYTVVGIFAGLAVFAGRRAGCHTICWMAPFMVLGRKLRNLFHWPALRLKAAPENCINCKKCTGACPMSLDVNAMVQASQMENAECILCGTCVDTCPKKTISYSFSAGK